ncbi:hypothetical protein [Cupriavidus gilardii]|uniref:Uncharacterized protein n=1 Tax=Cupriavidus gilardii TaxID=82541 RepID=A0ABY4VUI7_9BURK|nr:hypothetical protein [Cupriavidus gilardii]MCT9125403.1 hypothetical protein [Cupriavidus gilardii]USE79491.1 hypothetical protein NDR89_23150 [Cupriavidus gilardii]
MDDQARFEIDRGDRAKRILEDPLVVEALAAIKQGAVDAWVATDGRDVEAREYLHRFLKAVGRFEAVFASYIQTGELQRKYIEQEEERKSIMQRTLERIRG